MQRTFKVSRFTAYTTIQRHGRTYAAEVSTNGYSYDKVLRKIELPKGQARDPWSLRKFIEANA